MQCGFEKKLLSMYIDCTLDRRTRRRAEEHLAECKECRSELEDFRALGEALQCITREPAPPELVRRILSSPTTDIYRPERRNTFSLTAGAVYSAAVNGFNIESTKEPYLRRELPGWVARWVLFV